MKLSFTEFEWDILAVMWRYGKVTARQIWEELYPNREKAYTTVQTVIERMVKKGVVKKEKLGPINLYSPVIPKEEATRANIQRLTQRVFGGSFGSLAAFLLDTAELSKEELEHIKRMIEEKEKELKS